MHACIFPSGNDAAFAIADAMTGEISAWNGTTGTAQQFVDLMNDRAAQIGMTDTSSPIRRATDPGDPFSPAYDMWLLAREAMANPLFRQVASNTSYMLDKVLPGNEAGIFNTVPGGIWQALERVPAGRAPAYQWQEELSPQANRFLRVRGHPVSAK